MGAVDRSVVFLATFESPDDGFGAEYDLAVVWREIGAVAVFDVRAWVVDAGPTDIRVVAFVELPSGPIHKASNAETARLFRFRFIFRKAHHELLFDGREPVDHATSLRQCTKQIFACASHHDLPGTDRSEHRT
jgi:hypothetical protein